MNAPYEVGNVSISATAEALLAMEKEIQQLELEEERLAAKRKLIHTKLASCHAVIKALLLSTGTTYKARELKTFSEFNIGN